MLLYKLGFIIELTLFSGSAPPSSVSTQSLKLLTGECSQPRQFVNQFSACSAQHIP